MDAAFERWGTANWADLLAPAITLAEDGFEVSARLAGSVARDAERLSTFARTRDYFFPNGEPIAEGMMLTNFDYAATLRAMISLRPGSRAAVLWPLSIPTVR